MRKRSSISALIILVLSLPLYAPANADQLHNFTLPDDGPRYESPEKGPDGSLFTDGIAALGQERYQDAEQIFDSLVKNFPTSPLVEASRAFLADLIAKGGTDHQRRQAIDAYRALIRADRFSANAPRARWRIGDLYAQGGWLIEAKASYEQALAESPKEAPRALLGLGLVYLEGMQWKDAVHTFQQLKMRSEDERLIVPATFGLAEALGRAKQWDKAQSAYESGIRRWPAAFKLRPVSMLLFADVKARLQKHAEARALLEQFYNLYPTHAEAPSALIQIGDSWRQAARLDRAKTLYAAVIQKHPGTYQESVARMRLAEVARESFVQEPKAGPELGIEAMLEGRPAVDADSRAQEDMLEQIAQAYAGVELGSEALFHLGEHVESLDRRLDAIDVYRRVSDRKGLIVEDPWPEAAGRRLVTILGPWMVAALHSQDDLTAVNLFHRHGAFGEELYAGNAILLQLAEAHHRLGFSPQAIKLFRSLVRDAVPDAIREKAFVGLGLAYLEQQDWPAARRVFERTLLQYPMGQSRPTALKHLAETLHRQGEWNAVIRVCRLWLRRADARAIASSEGLRVRHLLAHAQLAIGHASEALETLARTIPAASAKIPDASLRYADQLLVAGQYEQAATRYLYVIQATSSPTDAEWARLQLAKVRRAQKRYGDARVLLQEVQSMTTDDLVGRISAALLADLPQTRGRAGG
jgi:TolA-binding protein